MEPNLMHERHTRTGASGPCPQSACAMRLTGLICTRAPALRSCTCLHPVRIRLISAERRPSRS